MQPLSDEHAERIIAAVREFLGGLHEELESIPPLATQPEVLRESWSWWVEGWPTTFATSGERAWRQAVIDQSPAPADSAFDASGVALDFVIGGAQEGYQAADLDNLLEPTLSGLVNAAGWFGGRRPNLRWIAASKRYDQITGCRINTLTQPPPGWDFGDTGTPVLDSVCAEPLPRGLRDIAYSSWVAEAATAEVPADARVAVALRFGPGWVNLGDIATGPVKPLIDCLWPILGGVPPSVNDWRVAALLLDKRADDIDPGSVSICIRPLSPPRV